MNPDTETVEGYTKYNESLFAKQPFLLHYDLVTLSFIMNFTNGVSKELFSEFLLCMSKNQEDTSNIQKILQELIAFDDAQVGEWIFPMQTEAQAIACMQESGISMRINLSVLIFNYWNK